MDPHISPLGLQIFIDLGASTTGLRDYIGKRFTH